MLSRILGLVREQLFAALLGATQFADAFVVAFRIPNLARDLFAEGVLSAAFVPTFADYLKRRGREAAYRLANIVMGFVLVVVGGIALIGMLFAPEIVSVIAAGFNPEKQALTTTITRYLFPFLPIVSLAAVVMGQLNAQERYTAPALAPATFNVAAIVTGTALLLLDTSQGIVLLGWAGAMLLGGLAQLLVQIPSVAKTGYKFRPRLAWKEPGLRRIVRLMLPATIGLAALNVNWVVNTFFASQQDGAPSWLSYAFRLIYLPIGVFAVAVATICTTRLAQRAAERDMDGLRATLSEGVRLVSFLTVPSTIGLIVLREPIVRLIFERGEFLASDTVNTAAALLMYSLGLFAYSCIKVMAPAFYALDRARVPLVASLIAVAVNLVLNVTLFPVMGFRGLALGTAAASTTNVIVLVTAFQKSIGGFELGGVSRHWLKVVLASVPCGAAAWFVVGGLESWLGTDGTLARIVAVGGAIVVGAGVYAGASRLLRLAELDEVLAFVRRR